MKMVGVAIVLRGPPEEPKVTWEMDGNGFTRADGIIGGSMVDRVLCRWWFQIFWIFTPTRGK